MKPRYSIKVENLGKKKVLFHVSAGQGKIFPPLSSLSPTC